MVDRSTVQLKEDGNDAKKKKKKKKKTSDPLIPQMTELKASQFRMDLDFRNKMKTVQKEHEAKVESIQIRLKASQKEVSALSKLKVKPTASSAAASAAAAPPPPTVILSSGRRSSSGSDSPGTSWEKVYQAQLKENTSSCYLNILKKWTATSSPSLWHDLFQFLLWNKIWR